MKIDWSGARVLATLIVGLALVLAAALVTDSLVPLIPFITFGAWWVFPKIVKEV